MNLHSSSVQDSSSHIGTSDPITSSRRFPSLYPSISLSGALIEAQLPALQRQKVGAGRGVLPVPLHRQSPELQPEGPKVQPSALQVRAHSRRMLHEHDSEKKTHDSVQFTFICTVSAAIQNIRSSKVDYLFRKVIAVRRGSCVQP